MRILDWIKSNKACWSITLCVPVLVFGAWLRAGGSGRPAGNTAHELARLTIFIWGGQWQPRQHGILLWPARGTGGGDLFAERHGQQRFGLGQKGMGTQPSIFMLHDWSPGGKYFAFACDGHVRIRTGEDGQQAADVNVGGGLFNLTWLSPSRIAAFTWRDLYVLDLGPGGWAKTKLFTVTNAASISTLTRLSSDSVAWRQDNDVWVFDLRNKFPSKISDSITNPVAGFTLSEADGSLLMNCGANGGDLFRCSPDQPQEPWAHLGRIGEPGDYIYKVYQLDGGGYAWLESDLRDRDSRPAVENKCWTLFVTKGIHDAPVRVLGAREIEDCELNGDHLYVLGTQTNEPPGIWDYNVKVWIDCNACFRAWPRPITRNSRPRSIIRPPTPWDNWWAITSGRRSIWFQGRNIRWSLRRAPTAGCWKRRLRPTADITSR